MPSCCGFTSARKSRAGGPCSSGRLGPRTNWWTTPKVSAASGSIPPTPPVQVKRSFDTTYVFPPQDTKLKIGDTPRIAETLGYAGSIVELSAEDGRVVLRRGMKSGAMPERFSLVPAPINLQGVPDAVIAFAERFARGPAEADQALLDILMRRAPRLKGRAAGLPVRNPGEPLTDAVIRAVMDLDHSYLFIQGPPGTGKTYNAAHAIVALAARRQARRRLIELAQGDQQAAQRSGEARRKSRASGFSGVEERQQGRARDRIQQPQHHDDL